MTSKIVLFKKKKLVKPVLLIGLPGIGLVGKIALDYLITKIKTEKIGEIFSDSFPPGVHTKDGLLDLIKDELFLLKLDGREFVLVAGPVQPSLDFRSGSAGDHYEFASRIVELMQKLSIKEVYSLAGLNVGEERLLRKPEVIVAATDKKTLDSLKKVGCKTGKGDGMISGVAGLVLGLGKQAGFSGACLMGETSSNLVYGDHGAAKSVLTTLTKLFKFKLDMKDIENASKDIEKTFNEMQKQLKQAVNEKDDNDNVSYVR
ncbi:MAG: PAC2 family protein [archaeon]